MTACPLLVAVLWSWYETWRDNGFKDIDTYGDRLQPRSAMSCMRRVRGTDLDACTGLSNNRT